MASYTVHLPPEGKVDEARFVREGVTVFGLLVPLVWLIWHRLWLALMVYVAFVVAIMAIAASISQPLAYILSVVPDLFYFVEGNQLVRNRLQRVGWNVVGVVEASSARDAELRYFNEFDQAPAFPRIVAPVRPVPVRSSIGMFPE